LRFYFGQRRSRSDNSRDRRHSDRDRHASGHTDHCVRAARRHRIVV